MSEITIRSFNVDTTELRRMLSGAVPDATVVDRSVVLMVRTVPEMVYVIVEKALANTANILAIIAIIRAWNHRPVTLRDSEGNVLHKTDKAQVATSESQAAKGSVQHRTPSGTAVRKSCSRKATKRKRRRGR
jgi:hypothetical protein